MDYRACILAAVDFIEDNLFEEVSPALVAARIGFSEYHFHRVFQGMLGESMAGYIRKRRMAEAAKLLKTSERPIVEIALLSRFETHESFTRAFKKAYGINPSQYRNSQEKGTVLHKERMTVAMVDHLQAGVTVEPTFEVRGPELVVGLGGAYAEGSFAEIESQWRTFQKRMQEISQVKAGLAYGVCMAAHPQVPKTLNQTFVYIAGLPVNEVKNVPEGMVTCKLVKAKYAVFTHKGSLDSLPGTINYIWGTWIPKNLAGYRHADAPDFEVYDSRFDPESRSGKFEICVPVELV